MIFRTINHTISGSFDETRISFLKSFTGDNPISISIGEELLVEKIERVNNFGNKYSEFFILKENENGVMCRYHAMVPFRKYFYTHSQMRTVNIDNILNG